MLVERGEHPPRLLAHTLVLPRPHAAWLISWPYSLAMAGAVLEHSVEKAMFPSLASRPVMYLGLAMAIAGEALRKAAMVRRGAGLGGGGAPPPVSDRLRDPHS